MSDDRAFLDALRVDPDDVARWLVYADWLDDHGDPRGEYIRLVQALAAKPDPDRRRRLNAVRPTLPRDWLAEVEQPALIRANPTPYGFYWRAFPLDVRAVEEAYTVEDYRTLPPVPIEWILRFDDWFARLANEIRSSRVRLFGDAYAPARAADEQGAGSAVQHLSAAASDFGLKLPESFDTFFRDDGHSVFMGSDGYYFDLPERIVPAPDCPEAGLIRFYSDCQNTMHWYLYLTPEGDECVVAADARVGGRWADRQMAEQDRRRHKDDDLRGVLSFCAPSFVEFIIRSWLETMAFYSIHAQWAGPIEARGAQAPEVRAYLDHYRRSP